RYTLSLRDALPIFDEDRVEKEPEPQDRSCDRGRSVPEGLVQKGLLSALGALRPRDGAPRQALARPFMTVPADEAAEPLLFGRDGSERWRLLPRKLRAFRGDPRQVEGLLGDGFGLRPVHLTAEPDRLHGL